MGKIRSFARQLIHSLYFLKTKRIVYGNLRPSKVLLRKSKRGELEICISDFSNVIEETTTLQDYDFESRAQLYGHRNQDKSSSQLPYLAPELIVGGDKRKTMSSAVDIWSFGCVLLELIKGKALFPAKNEEELLAM